MKNFRALLALISLSLVLTACGDDPARRVTTQDPEPNSYYDPAECAERNQYGVGIRGNAACPYQGEYDSYHGYQDYTVSFESQLDFNLGVGYRIDFGWDNDWENVCPVPGQIPVFVNGRFNHCDTANPAYADQNDGTNTSACVGSQYNPTVTGCTPSGVKPTR